MLVLKRSYFIGQKSKVDFSLVAARRTETRKGRAGQTSVTETATCQCPLRCRSVFQQPAVRRRKVTSETTETVSEKQLRTNFAASRQTSSAARQAAWLHTAPHGGSTSVSPCSVFIWLGPLSDGQRPLLLTSVMVLSVHRNHTRTGEPRTAPTTFTDTILNCSDRASCHGMAMTDQWQNSNRLFHY